MKKNLFLISLMLMLTFSCFMAGFVKGKKSSLSYEDKCNFVSEIVDWNTDGEELSVFTKDGYEFYAYKTEDIYKNKLFVSIKEDK